MPVTLSDPETTKPPNTERITVVRGLSGQDDHFDLLERYFKEMQKATVETSTPVDFVSFATCAHYFGVIMMNSGPPEAEECGDEDAEGELEEETEPVADAVYPASLAPTSPPASSTRSSFSIIDPDRDRSEEPEDDGVIFARFSRLSEQDKVLRWRNAFMAKVLEPDGDDDDVVTPSRNRIGLESDDEEGESFYSGKGKTAEHSHSFLIPHSQDNVSLPPSSVSDDPENFINWPEDTSDDNNAYRDYGGSLSNNYVGPVDHLTEIYSPIVPVIVDKEFGREYLQPDQYITPAPAPPKLPADPKYQAILYEEAVRYRDELRAKRIVEYERKKAKAARLAARQAAAPPVAPPPLTAQRTTKKPIGLIYLWTSQHIDDPLHVGEYSMGFYVAPEYRRKRHLTDALNTVVKEAFDDKQCHRLQAIVVEHDEKLHVLQLLTSSGFRHEGTRRHAFFSPSAQEWKDITYFAMLATEWVYDNDRTSSVRLRTTSLWDEVLTRHQHELDNLHRMEEKKLQRSNSVETIRQDITVTKPPFHFSSSNTQSTADSEMSGPAPASQPVVQRKKMVLGAVAQARRQRQGSTSSASGSGSNIGPRSPTSPHSPTSPSAARARYTPAVPSSPIKSRKRSIGGSSFGSASSSSTASSQWDLLEDMDVRRLQ